MAYNDVKNKTRQEIAKTPGFENYDTKKLNDDFSLLLSSMKDVDNMVQLYTKNSICMGLNHLKIWE